MTRRAFALAIFVATAVACGAPRLLETLGLAWRLHAMPIAARRSTLFGRWYADAEAIGRRVPRDASIDFVMLAPDARDAAVLGAAKLQPRDVRLFDGWDSWRRRERAELLHDARAANAVAAPPPAVAPYVVAVDGNALRFVSLPR